MGKGIFVTGTATDVGKTYVTGLIIKKLKEEGMNPVYFKAAMSGTCISSANCLQPSLPKI